MHLESPNYAETGLEVIDLYKHLTFRQRQLHTRDMATQIEGLRLLCEAFLDSPDTILQEVANSCVHLCGADSAGISLAQPEKGDEHYFLWVAVAGEWSNLVNSTLPKNPSACSLSLERGSPQVVRVGQRFFELMGVEASPMTDGILLPWELGAIRGTIWIAAHTRTVAFDMQDLRVLQSLAEFAKTGIRRKLKEGTPVGEIGSLQNLAIGEAPNFTSPSLLRKGGTSVTP